MGQALRRILHCQRLPHPDQLPKPFLLFEDAVQIQDSFTEQTNITPITSNSKLKCELCLLFPFKLKKKISFAACTHSFAWWWRSRPTKVQHQLKINRESRENHRKMQGQGPDQYAEVRLIKSDEKALTSFWLSYWWSMRGRDSSGGRGGSDSNSGLLRFRPFVLRWLMCPWGKRGNFLASSLCQHARSRSFVFWAVAVSLSHKECLQTNKTLPLWP